MLKTTDVEEADKVWNTAPAICEIVQAIVCQLKYVQLLDFDYCIGMQVYNLPCPTLIDEPKWIKETVFESLTLFDTLKEALDAFSEFVKVGHV